MLDCSRTLLAISGRTTLEIVGKPDNMKLQSSMTLFAAISPAGSEFAALLDKYFNAKRDQRTVELIKAV